MPQVLRSRRPLALPLLVVALALAGCQAPPRPNVLLILVDTLRADHLTPYGYDRATSPHIARQLADRGTVVETAWAPAPWTLPSMVGLFTGRSPDTLLGEEKGPFAIPPDLPTLAERMAALGYRTAGFFANPTLREDNGFSRGFETFYTAPAELASFDLHGDSINARALPWLAAHQREPFFLYLHYIDPHDPYDNPDVVRDPPPWLPSYHGPLTGASVHGLYAGAVHLDDPPADVAYLTALYDTEVRYVDRRVGEILARLDPVVLANTLVILTADHGEELHDHGGWKHGQTLYDEEIHVPLLVRWPAGGVRPGARLAGAASLLDVLPTVLAAAGDPEPPPGDGIDLLPALTGRGALPRRPLFAQHLTAGPLRAAAILGDEKLILFNRNAPFTPKDPLEDHLWKLDLSRFARAELYDRRRDPGEKHNRMGEDAAAFATLEAVIDRRLDAELPGLRMVLAPGSGGRVEGVLQLSAPPDGFTPLFLGDGDRSELDGAVLRFSWTRDALHKGVVIPGTASIAALAVTLDGVPPPAGAVAVGNGVPWHGGGASVAELTADGWPIDADGGAVLHLWYRTGHGRTVGRPADEPETARRLKNLGYVR